jgi:hypothetical protein
MSATSPALNSSVKSAPENYSTALGSFIPVVLFRFLCVTDGVATDSRHCTCCLRRNGDDNNPPTP